MTAIQEEVLSLLPDPAKPYDPKSTFTRDLLVHACTGTSTTLAFLAPIIEARIRAVENAGQKKFSSHHEGFEVRLLVGRMNKRVQLHDGAKGRPDIVVSTLDIAKALKTTRTLVLDEVNILLDIGFCDDISAIIRDASDTGTPNPISPLLSLQLFYRVARKALVKDYKSIDCADDSTLTHFSVPQYTTTVPNPSLQLPHFIRISLCPCCTSSGKLERYKWTCFTPFFAAGVRQNIKRRLQRLYINQVQYAISR
ncbi:uncharacterized protein ARMOST_07582 [Armillaria ostoyae]|uniref:ATP-dependent RNA helicase n=1 Tax=Armillaria ostoyae TaxID=47428 RepID=A0A284R669_ARMOS|nr:uncharacterized protein ARMOST_07582 [Armillaria ostoyae]